MRYNQLKTALLSATPFGLFPRARQPRYARVLRWVLGQRNHQILALQSTNTATTDAGLQACNTVQNLLTLQPTRTLIHPRQVCSTIINNHTTDISVRQTLTGRHASALLAFSKILRSVCVTCKERTSQAAEHTFLVSTI